MLDENQTKSAITLMRFRENGNCFVTLRALRILGADIVVLVAIIFDNAAFVIN